MDQSYILTQQPSYINLSDLTSFPPSLPSSSMSRTHNTNSVPGMLYIMPIDHRGLRLLDPMAHNGDLFPSREFAREGRKSFLTRYQNLVTSSLLKSIPNARSTNGDKNDFVLDFRASRYTLLLRFFSYNYISNFKRHAVLSSATLACAANISST